MQPLVTKRIVLPIPDGEQYTFSFDEYKKLTGIDLDDFKIVNSRIFNDGTVIYMQDFYEPPYIQSAPAVLIDLPKGDYGDNELIGYCIPLFDIEDINTYTGLAFDEKTRTVYRIYY